MFKKLVIAGIMLTLSPICLADTCPSVADIKKDAIAGWRAYDSDDGVPLSADREKQYKKAIQEFVLAEWASEPNHTNTIHCYYRDQNGSSLEAYLSKENVTLTKRTKSYWYQVSGSMHCAAGMDQCKFEQPILPKQHLAKK
jgi:hypothetical protein